jgi:hypothetical protein
MPTMRNANAWLSLACFLGCVLIAGCSNHPQLAEVRGRVTMNGKPIKNVRVDFHPDPDKSTKGAGSTGTTDADGNFTLTYGDTGKPGAIVGHHRVILTDLDVYGNVLVLRGDYRTEDPRGPKETPIKNRFSDLYSTLARTPFTAEVKPGMEPITFDIKR